LSSHEERAPDIEETLDNILDRRLEYNGKTELIIVDSSDDDTLEIIKNHRIKKRIYKYKKKGILNARNAGVHLAKGDVIVQVDSGTRYEKGWLLNLVRPFRDPRVVFTYGKSGGQGIRGFWSYPFQLLMHLAPYPGIYASGHNRAFRRESYFKAGGYNLNIDQSDMLRTVKEEEVDFPITDEEAGKGRARPDCSFP